MYVLISLSCADTVDQIRMDSISKILVFILFIISFFKIVENGKYMQGRRLRASNLPNRYDFEAGYNPLIYCLYAYFVNILLPQVICSFFVFFSWFSNSKDNFSFIYCRRNINYNYYPSHRRVIFLYYVSPVVGCISN